MKFLYIVSQIRLFTERRAVEVTVALISIVDLLRLIQLVLKTRREPGDASLSDTVTRHY
jgi:hypothetical protein